MNRTGAIILAGFVSGAIALPAAAVDVYRKSKATSDRGEITAISRTEIRLDPIGASKTPLTIPVNDIARVRWDKEPPKLNVVRGYEESGRIELALEGYQESLKQADAAATNLRTDLEFLIARATAKAALTDPQKLDEALRRLKEFDAQHPNHFRHFEALRWLGRVQLAGGRHTEALASFKLLEGAPWPEYKTAAQNLQARALLEQGSVEEALRTYEQVAAQAASDPAVGAQRYEALLGKALCLQRSSPPRHDEAIKTLEDVVHNAPPEDIRLQAEAWLRKGDSLQALGETKDALLAYLHVDVLFAREAELHAEALFHLTSLWQKVGKPRRAATARATLETAYPNSPWAKKLAGG